MSLAWGSKFLEYSATAQIVDTFPAVFRRPKWAGEACRVQYFAHSQGESQTFRRFQGCKLNSKRLQNARRTYSHFQEAL
jgi:hypothetical protein